MPWEAREALSIVGFSQPMRKCKKTLRWAHARGQPAPPTHGVSDALRDSMERQEWD